MNLQKLFEAQAVLDEHIMKEHPELLENDSNLDWKLLALQVELGECANEWRGFKKWSQDQKPRIQVLTNNPDKTDKNKPWVLRNLLIEEYVDCLHFILSIGLELDAEEDLEWDELSSDVDDVIEQFSMVFKKISELSGRINTPDWLWRDTFEEFYLLGKLLGFTWEQIEAAYFEKNKINHHRQESGY